MSTSAIVSSSPSASAAPRVDGSFFGGPNDERADESSEVEEEDDDSSPVATEAPVVDLVDEKERRRREGKERAVAIAIERQRLRMEEEGIGGDEKSGRWQRRGGPSRRRDAPFEKPLPRTRHGSRNQTRHKALTKWLLETFPHVLDSAPTSAERRPHVLDVAGGKGELSARLSLCHNIPVVMVDPRKADVAQCFLDVVLPKLPNKWQRSYVDRVAENPGFIREELDDRFRQIVAPFPFDVEAVEKCPELHGAVEGASLLVGMHADAATEAVVDVALRFRKPFVVVPCCVFPNLFNTRMVEDEESSPGRKVPVRSYDQFCRYLAGKDERFVSEVLPFRGCNVAIWWDGKG